MANLPLIDVSKKIKKRQSKIYNKNLDVHPLDSYFNKQSKLIHIEFPVFDEQIELKGLYFYNLGFMQILVIHICHKNSDTISDKKKVYMAVIEDFGKNEIINVIGNFEISNIEDLQVCIFNDDASYQVLDSYFTQEAILKPQEVGGGGVIVEGP